jgi:hypothetical protein
MDRMGEGAWVRGLGTSAPASNARGINVSSSTTYEMLFNTVVLTSNMRTGARPLSVNRETPQRPSLPAVAM